MNFSHVLTRILWICPLICQAAIVWVMLKRRLVYIFPVFFSYTVVVFSREVILLFLTYPGNPYRLVYWCGEILVVLLGLGVIVEILRHVILPIPSLRFLLSSVWILGFIAALTALLMFFLSRGGAGADRVFEFTMLGERSARFLQASLLIVVLALMSRLGLTWHNYSVGIVAGFGIYSSVALAAFEFRAHLHLLSHAALAVINSAAYNAAALIWVFYFWRAWRNTPVESLPKTDLPDWSEAVTDYVHQWYRRF
jgi:hypothetical protein